MAGLFRGEGVGEEWGGGRWYELCVFRGVG